MVSMEARSQTMSEPKPLVPLIINDKKYRVDPEVLSSASEYFKAFFSENWDKKGERSLSLEGPSGPYPKQVIANIISFLHGSRVLHPAVHLLKYAYDALMCSSGLAHLHLALYDESNYTFRRQINPVHLYLYDSSLVSELKAYEVLEIMESPCLEDLSPTLCLDLLKKMEEGVYDLSLYQDLLFFNPNHQKKLRLISPEYWDVERIGEKVVVDLETFKKRLNVWSNGRVAALGDRWDNFFLSGECVNLLLQSSSPPDFPSICLNFVLYGDATQRAKALDFLISSLCMERNILLQNGNTFLILSQHRMITVIDPGFLTLEEGLFSMTYTAFSLCYDGERILGTKNALLSLVSRESLYIGSCLDELYTYYLLAQGFNVSLGLQTDVAEDSLLINLLASREPLGFLASRTQVKLALNRYYHLSPVEADNRAEALALMIFGSEYSIVKKDSIQPYVAKEEQPLKVEGLDQLTCKWIHDPVIKCAHTPYLGEKPYYLHLYGVPVEEYLMERSMTNEKLKEKNILKVSLNEGKRNIIKGISSFCILTCSLNHGSKVFGDPVELTLLPDIEIKHQGERITPKELYILHQTYRLMVDLMLQITFDTGEGLVLLSVKSLTTYIQKVKDPSTTSHRKVAEMRQKYLP